MDILTGFASYIVPFLIVLTVLVFVHELGHYLVARRNGVRVDVFSIGFGPELFGWTDRAGTRWKVSAVPLGGYVKMFGDADAASSPDSGRVATMTDEERAVSFQHKRLGQRAAVVAAGPAANVLFAIVVLWGLFATVGHPFPPAEVGEVVTGSPAAQAGFRPGDEIVAVDDEPVQRFAQLSMLVRQSEGEPLTVQVRRDGEPVALEVTPRHVETLTAEDGTEIPLYQIGIAAPTESYGVLESGVMAVTETGSLTWMTLSAVGEMIVGDRGTEELGGPIRIAEISGDKAEEGVQSLIWLIATLSTSIGLINLFPIPVLDGGHLMFYAVEALRGRPLGENWLQVGNAIGLALVLSLMVFATYNDLARYWTG